MQLTEQLVVQNFIWKIALHQIKYNLFDQADKIIHT